MKEKPIIFSGEMVRAILDGRKSQTRRVVKDRYKPYPWREKDHDTPFCEHTWPARRLGMLCADCRKQMYSLCPYGQPDDRLYVKETHAIEDSIDRVVYQADMAAQHFDLSSQPFQQKGDMFWLESGYAPLRWRSSRFMPRWASRITLEITGVRVERVQAIGDEDIEAEGIEPPRCPNCGYTRWDCQLHGDHRLCGEDDPPDIHDAFISLWDSINAKRGYGWDANPWVWVIEFRGVES